MRAISKPVAAAIVCTVFSACGGGSGSSSIRSGTPSVSLQGLPAAEQLEVELNDGLAALVFTADGTKTFQEQVSGKFRLSITVSPAMPPAEQCRFKSNGSSTRSSSNPRATVSVICGPDPNPTIPADPSDPETGGPVGSGGSLALLSSNDSHAFITSAALRLTEPGNGAAYIGGLDVDDFSALVNGAPVLNLSGGEDYLVLERDPHVQMVMRVFIDISASFQHHHSDIALAVADFFDREFVDFFDVMPDQPLDLVMWQYTFGEQTNALVPPVNYANSGSASIIGMTPPGGRVDLTSDLRNALNVASGNQGVTINPTRIRMDRSIVITDGYHSSGPASELEGAASAMASKPVRIVAYGADANPDLEEIFPDVVRVDNVFGLADALDHLLDEMRAEALGLFSMFHVTPLRGVASNELTISLADPALCPNDDCSVSTPFNAGSEPSYGPVIVADNQSPWVDEAVFVRVLDWHSDAIGCTPVGGYTWDIQGNYDSIDTGDDRTLLLWGETQGNIRIKVQGGAGGVLCESRELVIAVSQAPDPE